MMRCVRGDMVGRTDELGAIDWFLDAVESGPAGLIIEGEPGIGKTTLWLQAADRAAARGMVVLSASGAVAEVTLTFAGLADLLDGVAPDVLAELDPAQQDALGRVSSGGEGPGANERLVAMAFGSALDRLSQSQPVILAVDDIQWLDRATQTVLGYAARRLTGRIGLLGVCRTGEPDFGGLGWLQLPRGKELAHLTLIPLSLGILRAMLTSRVGITLSRSTLVHIHTVSGGNPFYALEMARALGDDGARRDLALPDSLAGLVRSRIGDPQGELGDALLLAASAVDPRIDLIAVAVGVTAERLVELLEPLESNGVVEFDSARVRFTHPLLSAGVSTFATPAARRGAHRRLAEMVAQPELRARHLAMVSPIGDAATLAALDEAAEMTRAQGAPGTAAELADLAIALGGDTPIRYMRSADHHFHAGDMVRSRAALNTAIAALPAGVQRATALILLAGICVYTDGFFSAATHLETALADAQAGEDPVLVVQVQAFIGYVQSNTGRVTDALNTLATACQHAADLAVPVLISQVLSMAVMLNCLAGRGIDEQRRRRALDAEDPDIPTPIVFSAAVNNAQWLAIEGNLDLAREHLQRLRDVRIARGLESELLYLDVQAAQIEIWRGNFAEAAVLADDAVERAEQLGGDTGLLIASAAHIAVAVHRGEVDSAHTDATRALGVAVRTGALHLGGWIMTSLAFLEVSLGRYTEALTWLDPVIAAFMARPDGTEIVVAAFIPDAVETLCALGRSDEADAMVQALESNGKRLDRPWMRATGAFCRAISLSSCGDLASAETAVSDAIAEYDRLTMPFDRARAQLLHGQVLRRRRRNSQARAVLTEASRAFDEIGSPLWADRAKQELQRLNVRSRRGSVLTDGEERIAQLAAEGMSNKEIAADQFLSTKTVEAYLSSIYRKLGIRSRAQLAARLRRLDSVRVFGEPIDE